jgi:hypothetical protein
MEKNVMLNTNHKIRQVNYEKNESNNNILYLFNLWHINQHVL